MTTEGITIEDRTMEELLTADGGVYTHIAHALARGYTDLFYVNVETDAFIEYHTDDVLGVLTEARRGTDFFESCKREVQVFVHRDDREKFEEAMDPDFLAEALERGGIFEMTYRRIKDGRTFYVQMRVSRVEEAPQFIVIAVSDIDELMRQRRAEEQVKEERIVYARLHALTGNMICIYVVDPETDRYREINATDDYVKSFSQAKEGKSLFAKVRGAAPMFVYPKDLEQFLSLFTKEEILSEIGHSGCFTMSYRLMNDNRPMYVQMKAVLVQEEEGPRLIIGLYDIDAQMRQEKEYGQKLAQAQVQANIDALTGVKNRHAFLETEVHMDRQIESRCQEPFAVVMFDVNGLKKVNDTAGHQAGDAYLRKACSVICNIFKHSPVFRVGGDEFAVIAQGRDYEHMEDLLGQMDAHNREAVASDGVVVARGMARYQNDDCVATVFDRADHSMYENKSALKSN